MKKLSSNIRKIKIFPKGLTRGFGSNIDILQTLIFFYLI